MAEFHNFREFQLPLSLNDRPYWNHRRPPPPSGGRSPGSRQSFMENTITTINEIIIPTCLDRSLINPQLIFKIPNNNVDDVINLRELQGFCKFNILGIEFDGTVVIFATQEGLNLFKSRVQQYGTLRQKLQTYDSIGIPRIISPEERIGNSIIISPIGEGNEEVDIFLWYFGLGASIKRQTLEYINKIRNKIEFLGGSVKDFTILEEYPVIKARINKNLLDILSKEPCIRIIERSCYFEKPLKIEEMSIDATYKFFPPKSSVGILVLDESIVPGNIFIEKAIAGYENLPGVVYDDISYFHGTAISAFALYGDLFDIILSPTHHFYPVGRLYFASVFDPKKMVIKELKERLEFFITQHPEIKVVNLSISTGVLIDPLKKKQTELAGMLDQFIYNLSQKGRDIIVVISTGNYHYEGSVENAYARQFRTRILDLNENRISDPGTSALSITVGSICLGLNYSEIKFNESSLCKEYFPSLITRVGPGVCGGFKPEFVEFGSDSIRLSPSSIHENNQGVVTIDATEYGPFKFEMGTSFSAAIVTHKVADLWNLYPNLTSNSIKCLLALGADFHPNFLEFLGIEEQQFKKLNSDQFFKILNIFGYGRIVISKSKFNERNWVVLLRESQLSIGKFDVFDIPLPDDFFTALGDRKLSLAIAFDPPTKPTRKDYLGLEIDYYLFKNIPRDLIQKYYEKVIVTETNERNNEENLNDDELISDSNNDEVNELDLNFEELRNLDLREKSKMKTFQKHINRSKVKFFPSKDSCDNCCLMKHQIQWNRSTKPPNEHGYKILIYLKLSTSKWLADLIDSDFKQRYSVLVGVETTTNIELRTKIREKIRIRLQQQVS